MLFTISDFIKIYKTDRILIRTKIYFIIQGDATEKAFYIFSYRAPFSKKSIFKLSSMPSME